MKTLNDILDLWAPELNDNQKARLIKEIEEWAAQEAVLAFKVYKTLANPRLLARPEKEE